MHRQGLDILGANVSGLGVSCVWYSLSYPFKQDT